MVKFICVGYYKTGTYSLRDAMEILGFKAEHTHELRENHYPFWINKINENRCPTVEEIQNEYKNVDFIADGPIYFMYDLFIKAFPNAKLIYTIRDKLSCYTSLIIQFKILESTYYLNKSTKIRNQFKFTVDMINLGLKHYYSINKGKENGISISQHDMSLLWSDLVFGEASNVDVKLKQFEKLVGKKKDNHNDINNNILVFDVKQGWNPLCNFIGCKVPTVEFPFVNVGSNISIDYIKTCVKQDRHQFGSFIQSKL